MKKQNFKTTISVKEVVVFYKKNLKESYFKGLK